VALSIPGSALPTGENGADVDLTFGLIYLAFTAIGALIVSRRPRNAIGWLFGVFGLIGAGIGLASAWALHSLYAPGSALPAGPEAAWVGTVLGALLVSPLVLVLVLFPDGHLPGRAWRAVLWLLALDVVLLLVSRAFAPGPLDNIQSVSNPLGVEGGVGPLDAVGGLGLVLGVALLAAAAVSMVLRFRRSRGLEREQIKWFAAGAVVGALLFGGVLTSSLSESLRNSEQATAVTDVLVAIGFVALPISAGIAILRHRLYDIDVVINRTLVYAALTATLAAAYIGSVLLLQLLLSPGSDIAIAGSTLAVPALFRPLRTRIQKLVDRRFFRSRYDAAVTLAGFGARLRDEVELESVSSELRGVVRQTMQPAHVSLWLRGAAR
jgi:hypothetical protein